MKIDYHIHSTFSADAFSEMEDIVRKAIQRGYTEIAFTEHYDLLPSEIAVYGVPPYNKYQERIAELQQKYPGIKLLLGIEAGEMHLVQMLYDQITKYKKPDLLIASIHLLSDGKNTSVPFEIPLKSSETRDYYAENLKLVKLMDFDILGHLGIYKRYYKVHPKEEDACIDLIKEIFNEMIRKNIALEINYSGLRKTLHSLIPEPAHIQLYLDLGGKLLTIGSDAHHVDQFDDLYEEAILILNGLGIKQLYHKVNKEWEAYGIELRIKN
jgi:histidinol-phosphatase (PHP family)